MSAAKSSAGLLVWRRTGAGPEVLIAHMGGPLWAKKHERAWSIPKGEYGPDEEPLAAAYREFEEELGTPPPSGAPVALGEVRQRGGKIVTVWAIEGEMPAGFDPDRIAGNIFELEWPPRSGRRQHFPEMDRAGWVDPTTARTLLVAAQVEFLDRGPWVTHT